MMIFLETLSMVWNVQSHFDSNSVGDIAVATANSLIWRRMIELYTCAMLYWIESLSLMNCYAASVWDWCFLNSTILLHVLRQKLYNCIFCCRFSLSFCTFFNVRPAEFTPPNIFSFHSVNEESDSYYYFYS